MAKLAAEGALDGRVKVEAEAASEATVTGLMAVVAAEGASQARVKGASVKGEAANGSQGSVGDMSETADWALEVSISTKRTNYCACFANGKSCTTMLSTGHGTVVPVEEEGLNHTASCFRQETHELRGELRVP